MNVPSFKDADGRDWYIVLTVGKCRKVKQHCGLELTKLWQSDDGLAELITDPIRFAEILWVLCEERADTLAVTPDQFGDALDSRAIEMAFEAFTDAIVNFSPPAMRQAIRNAIDTTQEAQAKTGEAMASWVQSPKVQQMIDAQIQKAVEGANATLTGGN